MKRSREAQDRINALKCLRLYNEDSTFRRYIDALESSKRDYFSSDVVFSVLISRIFSHYEIEHDKNRKQLETHYYHPKIKVTDLPYSENEIVTIQKLFKEIQKHHQEKTRRHAPSKGPSFGS